MTLNPDETAAEHARVGRRNGLASLMRVDRRVRRR
jgi:hypothetical protein